MVRMRTASVSIRFAMAALLALLLALRSLAPAGFMPAFDHGAVMIVVCPDADGASHTMAMHHHGDHHAVHQNCPYASVSTLGALGADWPPLLAVVLFAAALVLGRTAQSIELRSGRQRPPATGPPIAA